MYGHELGERPSHIYLYSMRLVVSIVPWLTWVIEAGMNVLAGQMNEGRA